MDSVAFISEATWSFNQAIDNYLASSKFLKANFENETSNGMEVQDAAISLRNLRIEIS
jgi:hypothetical protein